MGAFVADGVDEADVGGVVGAAAAVRLGAPLIVELDGAGAVGVAVGVGEWLTGTAELDAGVKDGETAGVVDAGWVVEGDGVVTTPTTVPAGAGAAGRTSR